MVSSIKEVCAQGHRNAEGEVTLCQRGKGVQTKLPALNLQECVVVQADEAGKGIPGRKNSRCKGTEAERASRAPENAC